MSGLGSGLDSVSPAAVRRCSRISVRVQLEGFLAEGELDAQHLQSLRLDRRAEEAEVVYLVLVSGRVEEGRDADELAC